MYNVHIRPKPLNLRGTEAINWCRARGLYDRDKIDLDGRSSLQNIDVNPTFARIWFPAGKSQLVIEVDLDEFGREEIVDEKANYFADMGFKLRFKPQQVEWLVIRSRLEEAKLLPPLRPDMMVGSRPGTAV